MGNDTRVAFLIKQHPQRINDTDKYGYTALHYAARNNRLRTCQILLQAGADLFSCTRSDGATAAHRAAFSGCLGVLEELLKHGGEKLVTFTDNEGRSCLHSAYRGRQDEVISWLTANYPQLTTMPDRTGCLPQDLVVS
ncbi:hypothetical protein CRM22_006710 [Opisthorchis felineus]|uniref:Uncharacterized protein n=1 Tax=Opisthorchis felineus TaxID=147828 RepID=A0A4S2LSG7_OPIFE|nr:hypothetical protein CRM22_006710 [Opisthorchis felineus]